MSSRARTVLLSALVVCLAVVATACGDDSPPAPAPPLAESVTITTLDSYGRVILSPGDVHPDVTAVQERVNLFDVDGVKLDVTGVYDDDTLAVMLAFQFSQGLVPDGVIGPATRAALASPKALPDDLDPLTLVEIGKVSLTSPSDAQKLFDAASPKPPPPPPAASSTVPAKPSAPPTGVTGASAVVDLTDQHVELFDAAGTRAHRFPVSAGRKGLTPIGRFTVHAHLRTTVANSDRQLVLNYFTAFNGDIGFHGIPAKGGTTLYTPLGQEGVSAGCVRMDDADAKTLYDFLPNGASVIVRF